MILKSLDDLDDLIFFLDLVKSNLTSNLKF